MTRLKGKVRVQTSIEEPIQPPPQPIAVEDKDYAAVLTENLELLRKAESNASQVLEAVAARERAERELKDEVEKHAAPGGYRKGRKIVLGLHVAMSIFTMFFGPILWLKGLAPPELSWLSLLGLIWFIAVTVLILVLAEEER